MTPGTEESAVSDLEFPLCCSRQPRGKEAEAGIKTIMVFQSENAEKAQTTSQYGPSDKAKDIEGHSSRVQREKKSIF